MSYPEKKDVLWHGHGKTGSSFIKSVPVGSPGIVPGYASKAFCSIPSVILEIILVVRERR